MAWLAKRELNHASELVADESSLLLADGPKELAECLLGCAKQLRRRTAVAWLGMDGGGFRSKLGQRVARLLDLNPGAIASRRVPWPVRLIGMVLCAVVLWMGAAFATRSSDAAKPWRASLIGSAFAALAEPPEKSTDEIRIEVARLVQDGSFTTKPGVWKKREQISPKH